jgi:hypothetical protein
MRAFIAAVLLAGTVNAASRPEPAQRPPSWSVARSPHFEVYVTGSPSRATDALAMFEDAHAFFSYYLALPDAPRPPMRVLVFSGAKEYALYRPSGSADAFYQPGRNRDYIVLKDFDADAFPIVAHEYAHAALGLKGADFPPWLSEGLAEFFSTVSIDRGKAKIGSAPGGRVAALRPADLMPVATVLGVRRDSETYNTRDHAGLFYAESWALTHMLLVDEKYKAATPRLIALMQNGASSVDALQKVYGKSPAEIEKDLRAYIGRGNYGFFLLDFHPASPATASARPAAVPPFEASLVVADMMASQIGKDLETRAMLDAMAREQPDSLELTELRAFFELRTQGIGAADPYFKSAVERGSRNPTVLSEYALRAAGRDPVLASELLTRAMALAPKDPEIRIHAAAMMIRRQMPDDAMALLAPITRVPSNMEFEYYQIVANARAMAGDFDGAAESAARVMAAAHTPEEVKFAASFVAAIGLPPEVTKMIDGRIKNLNCDGATPVLEVQSAGTTVRLAIDDPNRIVIAGGAGLKLDLECGPQDTAARVGYSDIKPPDGTAGRVRFLDIKKKS